VFDSGGQTPGPAAIPREMIGKFVSYLAAGIGIFWLMPSSNIRLIHELSFICSRTFREIAIRASFKLL
jgi:hypothetical protein